MSTAATDCETSYLDVCGKKIQLARGGSGPPLLYLHSAAGETDWMPFHAALAERFTVYVPAHPGFATSTGLDAIRTTTDYAWHYVDLLDALQLQRVPVVGFSLGGWIAAELAIVRPGRVADLVLVNPAGLRVESAPMADLFIDDFAELKRLVYHDARCPGAELIFPSGLDDPKVLPWLRAREATARVAWNPYLHNPDLQAHLRRVECPTLVLCGKQDRLIPPAHGELYAQQIPGAKLEILADCGHMLPLEQPGKFVARTSEFLKAHS